MFSISDVVVLAAVTVLAAWIPVVVEGLRQRHDKLVERVDELERFLQL